MLQRGCSAKDVEIELDGIAERNPQRDLLALLKQALFHES